MSKKIQTKTEYVPVADLHINDKNPRFIHEKDFERLCLSIKENSDYFEARPILANMKKMIFAGTMRYRAAIEVGLVEVPVIFMDVSPEREEELMIRDNVNNGRWDFDILANEFDSDKLINWGVDMEAFNFDQDIADIEEITSFGEGVNFVINCKNIDERNSLKEVFGISGDKLDYSKFMEIWEKK